MKKILLLSLFWGLVFSTAPSPASFEENTHRYLTSYEVFDSLAQMLPFVGDGTCGKNDYLTQEKAVNILTALGENSTITGSPISHGPSQGTIAWISRCVGAALTSSLSSYQEAEFQKLIADAEVLHKLANALGQSPSQPDFHKSFLRPWKDLPAEVQSELIRYFVYSYLGSDDVLFDFGLIQNPDEFRQNLFDLYQQNDSLPLTLVLQKLVINLVLRDEFLSY